MSIPPPDLRRKAAETKAESLEFHSSSSEKSRSHVDSSSSFSPGDKYFSEIALLKSEIGKMVTVQSQLVRTQTLLETLVEKMNNMDLRMRSLEVTYSNALNNRQVLYMDETTTLSRADDYSSYNRHNDDDVEFSDEEYETEGEYIEDTISSGDEDFEPLSSPQPSLVEKDKFTASPVSTFSFASSTGKMSSVGSKRNLAKKEPASPRFYPSLSNASFARNLEIDQKSYTSITGEELSLAKPDPEKEKLDLMRLFPSRYDLFAALFVGIFDQIQQLADDLPGSNNMFSSSASDVYQRIQRLSSLLRYEGTNDELKLPERNHPSMIAMMKIMLRDEKLEVLSVAASTLMSFSKARTLLPAYRGFLALWSRLASVAELMPVPYCDILRYCSKKIVKSVPFDPKLDPSMRREFPAIYDIDLTKLKHRELSQTEKEVQRIDFNSVDVYLKRRYEGAEPKEAIKGLVKEKGKKQSAFAPKATAKKEAVAKPAIATLSELAQRRRRVLEKKQ